MSDFEHLPDAVLGLNRSPVFVLVRSADVSVADAIRYLRNPGIAGARLKRVPRERGLTVMYDVVAMPGVRVGRSVPSIEEKRDIADIRRVLGEACVLED